MRWSQGKTKVNERDWKLPFAAGNASYPIPQIF